MEYHNKNVHQDTDTDKLISTVVGYIIQPPFINQEYREQGTQTDYQKEEQSNSAEYHDTGGVREPMCGANCNTCGTGKPHCPK